jgi:Fibrobacter succinogenes major domain (Fib_succ_major).
MRHKKLKLGAILLLCTGLTGLQAQDTVKDADGNAYNTITIGKQIWMAENLKTTKYNDGTAIPYMSDSTSFLITTDPVYYLYNNDKTNKSIFGLLYNWFVLNTRKLCPAGWHVPAYEEWTTLITVLGGEKVAGGKLKETGTKHWDSPNAGATNVTGFTALPGGYRSIYACEGIGIYGAWWSVTEYGDAGAYVREVGNFDGKMSWNVPSKSCGFSVRCLKN